MTTAKSGALFQTEHHNIFHSVGHLPRRRFIALAVLTWVIPVFIRFAMPDRRSLYCHLDDLWTFYQITSTPPYGGGGSTYCLTAIGVRRHTNY